MLDLVAMQAAAAGRAEDKHNTSTTDGTDDSTAKTGVKTATTPQKRARAQDAGADECDQEQLSRDEGDRRKRRRAESLRRNRLDDLFDLLQRELAQCDVLVEQMCAGKKTVWKIQLIDQAMHLVQQLHRDYAVLTEALAAARERVGASAARNLACAAMLAARHRHLNRDCDTPVQSSTPPQAQLTESDLAALMAADLPSVAPKNTPTASELGQMLDQQKQQLEAARLRRQQRTQSSIDLAKVLAADDAAVAAMTSASVETIRSKPSETANAVPQTENEVEQMRSAGEAETTSESEKSKTHSAAEAGTRHARDSRSGGAGVILPRDGLEDMDNIEADLGRRR
ncbi:MAG: hypothetical protein MHM6MM_002780 [Cercozoa sp. M6MM]